MFSEFQTKDNKKWQKTSKFSELKISTSTSNVINVLLNQINSPSSPVCLLWSGYQFLIIHCICNKARNEAGSFHLLFSRGMTKTQIHNHPEGFLQLQLRSSWKNNTSLLFYTVHITSWCRAKLWDVTSQAKDIPTLCSHKQLWFFFYFLPKVILPVNSQWFFMYGN